MLQVLLSGEHTSDAFFVQIAINSLGEDGKFLYRLHDRLKVNANDR